MEYINQIIETSINSFDFTYCIVVNILTYLTITTIEDANNIKLSTWRKRIITLINIVFVGAFYIYTGIEYKLLFNSAILAPVFWSWIGKPVINKLKNDNN